MQCARETFDDIVRYRRQRPPMGEVDDVEAAGKFAKRAPTSDQRIYFVKNPAFLPKEIDAFRPDVRFLGSDLHLHLDVGE